MLYILAHRPDEFGLVPDTEGFVTYKELLWAIHEEPGWGYVRKGHINEVLAGKDRALFQPNENGVRALERRWHLDLENPLLFPPKILFVAVRRRAHPAVMEKGLAASGGKYIVLSSDREVAERIGRRRDQKPVVIEIMAASAQEAGVLFHAFGNLFLTFQVPARFINGPLISKRDGKTPERKGEGKSSDFAAGTFVLDLNRDPDPSRRTRGKKQKGWKEEARRIRRRKRHR
jgi:putative RNA 2'-phosphotransferase